MSALDPPAVRRASRAPRPPRGRGTSAGAGAAPSLVAARGARPWLVTAAATAASTYVLDAAATPPASRSRLGRAGGPRSTRCRWSSSPRPTSCWGAGLRVEPRRQLGAAHAHRHEHEPALQGRPRPGAGAPGRRAGPPGRGLGRATSSPSSPRRRRTTPARPGPCCSPTRVAATDAIVFLGGANLGAAAYEYRLARATRRFLDGR